jgi:hypothetical protein
VLCRRSRSKLGCTIWLSSLPKSFNYKGFFLSGECILNFSEQMLAIERLFELLSCNYEQAFVEGSA